LNSAPSPNLALALGFLVPGGGHFYAGKNVRGAAWFAVVSALTFAGWPLVGAAYFQANQLDLSSVGLRFSIPTVIPEIANFLETILAQKWLGAALPDAPLRTTAPWGFALTGAGGILNVLAMSEAHWLCRARRLELEERRLGTGPSPALAAALAWFLPGFGHIFLGRRAKGLLGGSALILTLVLGVAFSAASVGQRERDQFFWSGEVFLGAPFLVASVVNSANRIQSDIPLGELGLLCATIAGLLNILLILDAYATAERDLLTVGAASAPQPSAAGSPKEAPVAAKS
jgi:TM2 domain-containing membrane protein YozV